MTTAEQDGEHLRLLSVFHYVLGGMTVFFSSLALIHILIGLMFVSNPPVAGPGQAVPPAWFGWVFVVAGGFALLAGWALGGLLLLAGRHLARRRAYTFCVVVAGLSCLLVPIGTVLGVFTLLVLLRPTVKPLFA